MPVVPTPHVELTGKKAGKQHCVALAEKLPQELGNNIDPIQLSHAVHNRTCFWDAC